MAERRSTSLASVYDIHISSRRLTRPYYSYTYIAGKDTAASTYIRNSYIVDGAITYAGSGSADPHSGTWMLIAGILLPRK